MIPENEEAEFNSNMLENIMLDQLKALNNPDIDMDKQIKKTQAMVAVGNILINAAKVRIDAVRVKHLISKKDGKVLPLPANNKKIGNG